MRPRLPTPERSRFIDVLLAHAGRDGYRDRLRVHDLNLNRPVDVVMAISEQKYLGSRIGLAHAGGYWTLVLCHGERQSMN